MNDCALSNFVKQAQDLQVIRSCFFFNGISGRGILIKFDHDDLELLEMSYSAVYKE